eukprot:6462417-Amphidinium_carterae.1
MACIVHRVAPWLQSFAAGQRLWGLTPGTAVKTMRRLLQLLDVPEPFAYTLKSFRAGRATELAKQGRSLGDIMLLGEWKGQAVLKYLDTDAADNAQLGALLESESEEEA